MESSDKVGLEATLVATIENLESGATKSQPLLQEP